MHTKLGRVPQRRGRGSSQQIASEVEQLQVGVLNQESTMRKMISSLRSELETLDGNPG